MIRTEHKKLKYNCKQRVVNSGTSSPASQVHGEGKKKHYAFWLVACGLHQGHQKVRYKEHLNKTNHKYSIIINLYRSQGLNELFGYENDHMLSNSQSPKLWSMDILERHVKQSSLPPTPEIYYVICCLLHMYRNRNLKNWDIVVLGSVLVALPTSSMSKLQSWQQPSPDRTCCTILYRPWIHSVTTLLNIQCQCFKKYYFYNNKYILSLWIVTCFPVVLVIRHLWSFQTVTVWVPVV